MIKKIPTADLKVGMYIHDLDCGWMNHPFVVNQFKITKDASIEKIVKAGIKNLYIDTDKGLDLKDGMTEKEVKKDLDKKITGEIAEQPTLKKKVSLEQEKRNAVKVFSEAQELIQNVMGDARLGKQIELESVEPVVEKVTSSVLRNQDAMLSLCRIKQKDQYTFQHSVSVCAMMTTFSRALDWDAETIKQVSVGALLHDIGKMMVPPEVLNKPGRLNDEEFKQMQCHVVYSRSILEKTPGITQIAIDTAAQHHERKDGSGYPLGLKGDEISLVGKNCAIVDVYDALTSVRCYKDGWQPTATLKKMLEWSDFHFERDLLQQFIRCIGIYPVGTVVRLDSGLIAIVMEQGEEDLLRPTVRVIYNSKKQRYTKPTDVDLARAAKTHGSDHIVAAADPEKYGIDIQRFS